MATDPVIKSNGTVVLIPSDGAIQAGQDFPGLQPAGTVQGIQNVGQQPGGSNNEQIQEDLLKKLHKIEIKTLGAIQVMLGLIYISLATIVIVHFRRHYKLFTSIIGYPFWSGIFFIFSGLLSVAAEKYPNKALVMSSVRMNITSAIMAVIGIILYALEIDVNNKRDYSDTEGFFLQSAGTALAVLLLMLTMLEFAITVSLAHLGMKAASNNMATTVLPHDGSPAEGNPEPLVYDDILVTATEPVRMSNGAVVLIPSNLAGVPQTDQYFPGPQLAGTVHYVQYAGQQYGSPNNQENQDGLLNKLRKAETKPLGAIQILIGVILIGLGVISFFTTAPRYNILPLLVGYPFWGGIFFIVSGSLAVSAENYPNSTLVKVSVGMNITSAVMAFIGTALYMVQLAKNSNFKRNELDSATPIGTGLAVFLLLFSILEFAITVSLALFGYEATCCGKNEATTVSPYPVFRQDGSPTEGNPEPPANNNNAESSLKSL